MPLPSAKEVSKEIEDLASKSGMTTAEFLRAVSRIQYRKGVFFNTDGLPGHPPDGTARWRQEAGHVEVFLDGEWHVLTPNAFNWFIKTMNNELSRAETIEHNRLKDDIQGLALVPNQVAGYREPAMTYQRTEKKAASKKRHEWTRETLIAMEVPVAVFGAFAAGWMFHAGFIGGVLGLAVYMVIRQWLHRWAKKSEASKRHAPNCGCIRCELHKHCPVCLAGPGEPCDAGLHS